MSSVPRLVQGIAKGQINKAYQEAVRDMTADQQAKGLPVPADLLREIVMLPDWDGKELRLQPDRSDRQAAAGAGRWQRLHPGLRGRHAGWE